MPRVRNYCEPRLGHHSRICAAGLDLLAKMLTFDPAARISVPEALEHPWLASYHDVTDEPDCPEKFEKWREIEKLETLEEFREALWNEIEDYRREVRGINLDLSGLPIRRVSIGTGSISRSKSEKESLEQAAASLPMSSPETAATETVTVGETDVAAPKEEQASDAGLALPTAPDQLRPQPPTPTDPVVTYARRSSIMQPSRQGSTFNSPLPVPHQHLPFYTDGSLHTEPGSIPPGGVVFPSQGYVLPARSRTASIAGGGEVTRKLLRTLSTVSIHESVEGLPGGLAGLAPIGKYIMERQTTEADAPPSEMPREFGIDETSEGEEDDGHGGEKDGAVERKECRFRVG